MDRVEELLKKCDEERLEVQQEISRNVRKLQRLVQATDELLDLAIKLEVIVKTE